MLFVLCFFFQQKSAYEIRISDWSSDVCSSDLRVERIEARAAEGAAAFGRPARVRIGQVVIVLERHLQRHRHRAETLGELGGGHGKVRPTGGGYLIALLGLEIGREIGRASGRERVC